ncbi:MAG: hypothetical protein JRF33_12340 [Deltaproteobacteria bacterium]|nr:hypothetical protein [Deltaproteobacteria bacterium]
MHFRRWKFALWFSLLLAACSFDPIFNDDYQRCSADNPCPGDCVCSSVGICLPPNGTAPDDCLSEDPDCVGGCNFGCRCVGGLCLLPGRDDQSYCNELNPLTPYEMDADLVVTTTDDQLDREAQSGDAIGAGANGLSLREALTLARVKPGPHHITFDSNLVQPVTLRSNQHELPWQVPSLCYLDGRGIDVTLAGEAGKEVGLLVNSTGVVISDLTLIDFESEAVKIRNSAEVHLFRMRIQENGGTGLLVENSEDIWLGRGRELAFESPKNPPSNDLSQYDMNVIRSNEGNGVEVSNSSGIYIYGSFIGYDLATSGPGDCIGRGNAGAGIILNEVREAIVGAQEISDDEYESWLNFQSGSGDTSYNMFPGFVAVGCNQDGGVRISGGGDIQMPGLGLGNSAQMSPYGQNNNVNLEILDIVGPVSFGPSPWMTDLEILAFGIVYYDGSLALHIENNEAEVVLMGAQFVNLGNLGHPFPEYAIKIVNTQAPVRLYHLAITGSAAQAAILLENPGDEVSIINTLFWRDDGVDTPILAGAVDSTRLSFHHNMQFGFSRWLLGGDGDVDASNFEVFDNPVFSCNPDSSNGVVPKDPVTCLHVNAGADLGLDRSPFPGEHVGCAPDIGAFECVTEACRNVSCQ